MGIRSMDAQEYRATLAMLGLSQGQIAKGLGYSLRSSNGYANGDPIPDAVALLLRMMIYFNLTLADIQNLKPVTTPIDESWEVARRGSRQRDRWI